MKPVSIAIDGPAGAGKSTIAKALAKKRGMIYVDTGAMYRAIALYFIRNQIKADEIEKIEQACENIKVSIAYENGEQIVLLNGENVNSYIRTQEVGNMASVTSAYARVRERLVELQRAVAKEQSVVMDGRDIGTCVLPNADVKIYLTASVEIRAKRRYDEMTEKGVDCDYEVLKREIAERDTRDMTRKISPLRKAEDAVELDTTEMTIEEVIATMDQIVQEKMK